MITIIKKRRLALTVAAAVLVVGVVAGRERPAIDLVRSRAPAPAAALDADIDLERLRRGEAKLPQNDPFVTRKAAEPKLAQAPNLSAPAQPAVPPIPFQYVGRWSRGDKAEVLVMRDQELVSIERGTKLGDYRVDEIGEKTIGFTYLPLKMKQTLDLPE